MATDVKRSLFKTFLNTTPSAAATYNLLGDGVTTGEVNMNPKTTEETYIHEDVARTSVDAYAPVMPIEASAKAGDAVFDYVDNLYRTMAVGADCATDIVHVYLYETPTGGAYPAVKHEVNVSIDSYGGEGGAMTKIAYTLNYKGTPVQGTFNPTTKAFTAA